MKDFKCGTCKYVDSILLDNITRDMSYGLIKELKIGTMNPHLYICNRIPLNKQVIASLDFSCKKYSPIDGDVEDCSTCVYKVRENYCGARELEVLKNIKCSFYLNNPYKEKV